VVSVAVSVALKGSTVTDSRVVFGGLAPFPTRSVKAESALKGKDLKSAVSAACSACVIGAQPLGKNAYKIEATKGVLEEALNMLA